VSKVLLVTGASRGIGRATARLAAERGYAVRVSILWLLSDEASYTSGAILDVAGGR
jgi:NAD(P)-dependent dehydrogenase (short-subunit alcohol dehydrogenase family)